MLKNNLEIKFSEILKENNIDFGYETEKINFIEIKKRYYKPDFVVKDKNGNTIFFETKGWFKTADRTKHMAIKKHNEKHGIENKRVVFIFQNENNKINKKSKTTYKDWCEKNGFECCNIKTFDINNYI